MEICFFPLFLWLLLPLICLSLEDEYNEKLGGYSPISDLDDQELTKAATFAVQEASKLDQKYSFRVSASESSAKVVLASEQVVAGLNLRMIIMVTKNKDSTGGEESCQGAFVATVYNHFGSLEVTDWGKEYSCQEVLLLQEGESKQKNDGE